MILIVQISPTEVLSLDVDRNSTVFQFKQRIIEQANLSANSIFAISLLLNGEHVLFDTQLLKELEDNSTILLQTTEEKVIPNVEQSNTEQQQQQSIDEKNLSNSSSSSSSNVEVSNKDKEPRFPFPSRQLFQGFFSNAPNTENTELVHLYCFSTAKNLRINTDGNVNGFGRFGNCASFYMHKIPNRNANETFELVKFQNKRTLFHWLRINNKKQLDGFGKGGPWTVFILIRNSDGSVSLRSKAHESEELYLSVSNEGVASIARSADTNDTKFSILPAQDKKQLKKKFRQRANKKMNCQWRCNKDTRRPRLWWVDVIDGQVPPLAIEGGRDIRGETLYVCRAYHEGGWHPGKFGTHLKKAHIPYADREVLVSNFQILCGTHARWRTVNLERDNDDVALPRKAFVAGYDGSNPSKSLYIARAFLPEGGMHCGKIGEHLKKQGAHVSFGGKVIHQKTFEILVGKM